MSNQRQLMVATLFGLLLIGTLFVPGARRAVSYVFSPLRSVTYPRANYSLDGDQVADMEPSAGDVRVVSYSSNPARRQIVIDNRAGQYSVGAAVLSRQVLVGVITQIDSTVATVTLINDPQFRLIAQTSAGARGLINSSYDQILLSDVAVSQQLSVGDKVFSVNNQFSYGQPILIGVVDDVVTEEGGLLKSAVLSQPVSLDNLAWVEVR